MPRNQAKQPVTARGRLAAAILGPLDVDIAKVTSMTLSFDTDGVTTLQVTMIPGHDDMIAAAGLVDHLAWRLIEAPPAPAPAPTEASR